MAFHFQEGSIEIPQPGFSTLSCKHVERLQLHRACRENLPYEKTITLRHDPVANKWAATSSFRTKFRCWAYTGHHQPKAGGKFNVTSWQLSSMSYSLFTDFSLSPTEDPSTEHHVEISFFSILFSVYYLKTDGAKAQILSIPRFAQLWFTLGEAQHLLDVCNPLEFDFQGILCNKETRGQFCSTENWGLLSKIRPSLWHCSWKGNFFSVAKSFLMCPSVYPIWCNASHEISCNLLISLIISAKISAWKPLASASQLQLWIHLITKLTAGQFTPTIWKQSFLAKKVGQKKQNYRTEFIRVTT